MALIKTDNTYYKNLAARIRANLAGHENAAATVYPADMANAVDEVASFNYQRGLFEAGEDAAELAAAVEELLAEIESGRFFEGEPVKDVTKLPDENIDAGILYRLSAARFVHNRSTVDKSTCHIVDSLPAESILPALDSDGNINAYYNTQDNTVKGYYNGAWESAEKLFSVLSNGAYTYDPNIISNVSEDPKDSTIRLLIERKVFTYRNEWLELTNSAIDERLPTPTKDSHWAYTVQRREGVDHYELHIISHAVNTTYRYEIPLRDNGIIKTLEPVEDDDCANKGYVDAFVNELLAGLDSIITAQNELLGG